MAKTFFYKTKKGKIIAMEEREASLTGKFYELIGCSDGRKYEEITLPAKLEFSSLQSKMNEYSKLGRPVPDELYDKFVSAKIAFQDACTKGFAEELEIAKQNPVEKPKNTEWSSLEGNIERPNWAK